MGKLLCWLGWHRRSPFWRKAYNVRTGNIRLYLACGRCEIEMPEDA
jgi:hypothetical protein